MAIASRTFTVGHRVVTVSLPDIDPNRVGVLTFDWTPDVPTNMSEAEWAQYRAGRDTLLAEVSRILDGRVIVAEVDR